MFAAVALIPGACLSALPVRLACQCALIVSVESNQTIDHIPSEEISGAILTHLTRKAVLKTGKNLNLLTAAEVLGVFLKDQINNLSLKQTKGTVPSLYVHGTQNC